MSDIEGRWRESIQMARTFGPAHLASHGARELAINNPVLYDRTGRFEADLHARYDVPTVAHPVLNEYIDV